MLKRPPRKGKQRTVKYHIGTRQQLKLRALTEGLDPSKVLLLAIDSSKFFHKGLICDRLGQVLEPPFEFDIYQRGFERAMDKLRAAAERVGAVKVLAGIESTGHYHENLVRHLQQEQICGQSLPVILINPFSTNEMRNLNLNNIKTDDLDLDAIAELLIHHKGTSANLPEGVYLELRELTRWRRTRIDDRVRLKQQIHGHLDRIWPGLLNLHERRKALFSSLDRQELMTLIKVCPSPHKALELGNNGLCQRFRSEGCRMGPKRAARILNHATEALRPRPEDVEHRLRLLALDRQQLDLLNSNILAAEGRIQELLGATPGIWLCTLRGVGEITAAEVAGEFGDPRAYESGDAVVKLAGMNPSYCQTGVYESERNPITHFGRPTLRRTAVDTARRLVTFNPYFKRFYERLVDKGKPKKLAYVAVGSKFLRVCLAIMRRGAPFNPPNWPDKARVQLCLRAEGLEALQRLGLLEHVGDGGPDSDRVESRFEGDAAGTMVGQPGALVNRAAASVSAGRE